MRASSPSRSPSSPHLLAASTSIECLRDWVHATNKGTWQRLSAWWTRSDSRVAAFSSSHAAGSSTNSSTISTSAPAPAMVAAICALDTEDRPLDCASQHYYTYYDSDEGGGCGDNTSTNNNSSETQLELLQQLAQSDSDDAPLSSDARTVYCKYASYKSGVGA